MRCAGVTVRVIIAVDDEADADSGRALLIESSGVRPFDCRCVDENSWEGQGV